MRPLTGASVNGFTAETPAEAPAARLTVHQDGSVTLEVAAEGPEWRWRHANRLLDAAAAAAQYREAS